MVLRRPNSAKLARDAAFSLVSTLLLFLGFYANLWHVAESEWFASHQRDMESHIVGRVVKSRQDGILSAGGLTGLGGPDAGSVSYSEEVWEYQYQAYLHGLEFGAYRPYLSQIGGQGMLYSLLDGVLPGSPEAKIEFFYLLASLLSAFSLSLVILWFSKEFGLYVGILVLISTVLSQWLTVFGQSLWWSIWGFYLPMLSVMYFLRHKKGTTSRSTFALAAIVFVSVLAKCLVNGFEYITTTLVMMMVPFVYYGVLRRFSIGSWFRGGLAAAIGSCLAILLATIVLSFQIESATEHTIAGADHITGALKKRTYADPSDFTGNVVRGLEATPAEVVLVYLKGTYFDLNNYLSTANMAVANNLFKIRYIYLIALFLAASGLVLGLRRKYTSANQQRRSMALVLAAWFSILAPLSWFIVFKSHSFLHTHMNFITWQMPYTLFGFAVCGMASRYVVAALVRPPGQTAR